MKFAKELDKELVPGELRCPTRPRLPASWANLADGAKRMARQVPQLQGWQEAHPGG
jgi:hypothetical protein